MNLSRFFLAAGLVAGLALPATAQTMLTTPTKPAPIVMTPAPGTKQIAGSSWVDINSASAADLDTLPGIGKARANAIIKNRPYKAKDELLTRKVIPAKVYDRIKDKIVT